MIHKETFMVYSVLSSVLDSRHLFVSLEICTHTAQCRLKILMVGLDNFDKKLAIRKTGVQ